MKLMHWLSSKLAVMNTQDTVLENAPAFTVDQLEQRRLMASSLTLGMNINNLNSNTYDDIVHMLRDTGQKAVRVWYGFDSYGSRNTGGVLKFVPRLKAEGFHVMLSVVPRNGVQGNDESVKGLFNFLLDVPGLKGAVDEWQIGNEPDHAKYWGGSLSSYVNNFLQPAYDVLHNAGEKVVSAGPSWNPEDVKTLVKAGMLNYTDYVGYHPYRASLGDLQNMVAQVKSIVGGKPLVASEWNVRGHEADPSKNAWASDIQKFYPVIRDNFYAAYYFVSVVSSTKAGAAGVIRTDGSPNGPFYSAVKNLKNIFAGGGPDTTPDPEPWTPTPPTTPTTPTTGTPGLGAISLIDAKTNLPITGFNTLENGETIDLAKLPSRNLSVKVAGSNGTDSVLFTRDGGSYLDSTNPFALYGDNSGDVIGRDFSAGKFTFSAQPFAGANGTGTAGAWTTLSLNFIDSGSTTPTTPTEPGGNTPSTGVVAPKVSGITILDGKTGLAIPGYSNISASKTISLASLPTRNIRVVAVANGSSKSVLVAATGFKTHSENTAPFDFFTDSLGKTTSWNAVAGTYTFTATAFAVKNATGTKGNTLSVTLKFV